jgi:hypothetical protein
MMEIATKITKNVQYPFTANVRALLFFSLAPKLQSDRIDLILKLYFYAFSGSVLYYIARAFSQDVISLHSAARSQLYISSIQAMITDTLGLLLKSDSLIYKVCAHLLTASMV